jgi:hypothetical protein
MSANKFFPGRFATSLGRWFNAVALQMFAIVVRATTCPRLASAP